MRTILILYILLTQHFSVFAQWSALIPPVATPTGIPPTCNDTGFDIVPCGKGIFAFQRYCYFSPSSGGTSQMYYSSDDLQTASSVFSTPNGIGYGSIQHLTAFNDSTVAWTELRNGLNRLVFTEDRFKTRQELSAPIILEASLAMSHNYVFSLSQPAFGNGSIFTRCTKGSTAKGGMIPPGIVPRKGRMRFLNDSTGYVIVTYTTSPTRNSLIGTVDRGENWVELLTDTLTPLADFQVSSSGAIHLLKESGAIVFSPDGGGTWSASGSAPTGSYAALAVANDSTFYAGGSGGLLFQTMNKGNTWSAEITNTTSDIIDIYNYDGWHYFKTAARMVFQPDKQSTGIKNPSAAKEIPIVLYPNPAIDEITLSTEIGLKSGQSALIRIKNISGQLVLAEDLHAEKTTFDISALPNGVYVAEVQLGTTIRNVRVVKMGD